MAWERSSSSPASQYRLPNANLACWLGLSKGRARMLVTGRPYGSGEPDGAGIHAHGFDASRGQGAICESV